MSSSSFEEGSVAVEASLELSVYKMQKDFKRSGNYFTLRIRVILSGRVRKLGSSFDKKKKLKNNYENLPHSYP